MCFTTDWRDLLALQVDLTRIFHNLQTFSPAFNLLPLSAHFSTSSCVMGGESLFSPNT